MHQMTTGAIRNEEAMKMTEGPGNIFETGVNIDAMSIISALEHVNLKQPSEKSFLAHLAWLQDKILKRAISWLRWVDTRDMYADGLTKGSVSRERLQELASGRFTRKHDVKRLRIRHQQMST